MHVANCSFRETVIQVWYILVKQMFKENMLIATAEKFICVITDLSIETIILYRLDYNFAVCVLSNKFNNYTNSCSQSCKNEIIATCITTNLPRRNK